MEKKYGISFGGGAARGYVHIGVLKYLEEKNIKIGEISGTSMGALVGAFVAMGKKSKDLEKIAKEVKYSKMIDFDLKNGVLKGEKVKKTLEKYFGDLRIEELPIKLKIIAFNVETGEKKVFETGKIVDAIRASISIPGVFKPYKIGKENFIDGGIVANLPIDELSLENKIGISALKLLTGPLETRKKIFGFDFHKGFFSVNYQILYRSITYMMGENEKNSIKNCSGDKQILNFDFGELDFFSFGELEKFIEIGYKTAKKKLKF